jgi:hypothetical protein
MASPFPFRTVALETKVPGIGRKTYAGRPPEGSGERSVTEGDFPGNRDCGHGIVIGDRVRRNWFSRRALRFRFPGRRAMVRP